jgi:hypothetical protein
MRRPIFWFLWPEQPAGPLDDEAVQTRWIRVCGRGPWRWALLIMMTAIVIILTAAGVSALLAAPSPVTIAVTVILVIPAVALLARGWVAGTYVCDRGVKVSSILTTEVVPWHLVTAVTAQPTSRWLGLPLRVGGQHIVVDAATASHRTHVETGSPDLWLRPTAYDAAADRLRTWWSETR